MNKYDCTISDCCLLPPGNIKYIQHIHTVKVSNNIFNGATYWLNNIQHIHTVKVSNNICNGAT